MAERPPHDIALTHAEAIVAFDWLAREIGERQGANLLHSLAHVAEFWALNALFGALETVLDEPFHPDWRALLAAARQSLDPADPALVIDAQGAEDSPVTVVAVAFVDGPAIHLIQPAASTLVLFEYLSREIDGRHGANMLRSFVSPGEYWALANLQATLEPGTFYSVSRDFREQLTEARAALTPRPGDTFLELMPQGRDD